MFEGSRRWPARICRSSSRALGRRADQDRQRAGPGAPPARQRRDARLDVGVAGRHGHHREGVLVRRREGGDAEQGAEAPGRLGVAGDDRDLAAALGVGLGGAHHVRDGAHGLDAAREQPDGAHQCPALARELRGAARWMPRSRPTATSDGQGVAPAVAHERQRDPGDRHDAHGHTDVNEHLEADHRHDRPRHQHVDLARGAGERPQAPPEHERIEQRSAAPRRRSRTSRRSRRR